MCVRDVIQLYSKQDYEGNVRSCTASQKIIDRIQYHSPKILQNERFEGSVGDYYLKTEDPREAIECVEESVNVDEKWEFLDAPEEPSARDSKRDDVF